jgi:hypothetical protein
MAKKTRRTPPAKRPKRPTRTLAATTGKRGGCTSIPDAIGPGFTRICPKGYPKAMSPGHKKGGMAIVAALLDALLTRPRRSWRRA